MPMRSDGLFKHLSICLVIAVVFYLTVYGWIEHRRTGQGPWIADFRLNATGVPALLISQTNYNISETILFPAQTNRSPGFSRTIVFGPEAPDLPFGELLYQDPTFLPGTVTMRLFGHVVELLPRVLTIDKKEYPWKSGELIQLK